MTKNFTRPLCSKSRLEDETKSRACEIIYEASRRRLLEGKLRTILIFFLSVLLSVSAIASISILQYDEYFAFVNDRSDYINATKSFCSAVNISNIDVVSTPIAAILLLVFIVLYKRRVFLRDRFKFRNIGLPMIIPIWNKTDRLYSGFTYGTIAFNIFNVVRNYLSSNSNLNLIPFKDPSGLMQLVIKIVEVLLIGIRYYPVLVAYRANSFIICLLTSIYMWIDFVENIYQYGKCESISSESTSDKEELKRRLWYFIVYKILSSIPLSIFASFIVINLTYKATILLFDYMFRTSSYRGSKSERARDTVCCSLLNVEDENELLYSSHDIDYVYDLMNKGRTGHSKRPSAASCNHNNQLLKTHSMHLTNILNPDAARRSLEYCELEMPRDESYLKRFLAGFVYRWDPNYRFSSRFINAFIVALVALYYVWLYWSYLVIVKVTSLTQRLPLTLESSSISVNLGEFFCQVSNGKICIHELTELGPLSFPIPEKYVGVFQSIRESLNAIFIVPLFGALIICLIQLFMFVRDTRTHIIQLYKGECEYVVKPKHIRNHSIISYSLHFGGYLVGYMIWGYFILYIFWTLVGVAILAVRLFFGDRFFGSLAVHLVPVFTALLIKHGINFLASTFVFIRRDSKTLAINNFRVYNIFLYFNFYFDCFMGILSAVIRLIKSVLAAIFYMPRISYSFLGRHLERIDNGYNCYRGFLYMESMHTNPIMITFCSVLYYRDLGEFIRRHHVEKRVHSRFYQEHSFKLGKFSGVIQSGDVPVHAYIKQLSLSTHVTGIIYNRRIVNKWHVLLLLASNKDLIRYRKHNFRRKPHKMFIEERLLAFAKSCFSRETGLIRRSNLNTSITVKI